MAGIIPPEIVEQVRHASDIVDVIGGYVPLKKSGSKFKALSPFQKEKTPSFYVDPMKQRYHCFSSGQGGDVFRFLMTMENMTFPEAIRRLAQRASIVIPEASGSHDPLARSRREELLVLNANIAGFWQNLLKTDPAAEPARAYLKSRDFPESLAEEFGLGYAPDGWDTTLKWAQKKGHTLEALEAGRLVATSESGRTYDFFRARLMIPIYNDAGEVVAFSGRLLDPQAKAQKYVNSHETPVFIKSKILFGLNKTKRSIIEAGSVVVCEGQIDLMRCWQKGVRNVVASQGTAFTDSHARSLKRIATQVIICFDADKAGQNAAQKSIDVLLKEDLQIRIARIPKGEDPDSLLRKEPVEVFQTILREAKDYTRHLLDVASEQEDFATPRGRGRAAQEVAQVIAKMPNKVERERLMMEAATRLQVPVALVKEELEKAMDHIRRAELQKSSYPTFKSPSDEPAEGAVVEPEPPEPIHASPIIEALLSLLLSNPEIVPQVSRQLDPKWLEGLGGAEVIQQVLDAHAHDAFENVGQFLEGCDDRTRNYLTGLLMQPPPEPTESTTEAYADKLVRNFEKRAQQERLQMLNLAVKSDELSVDERMKYLMEIEQIRRKVRALEA